MSFDNSNIVHKSTNSSNVGFIHSHNNINGSECNFSFCYGWFSDDYGFFFFIKEESIIAI